VNRSAATITALDRNHTAVNNAAASLQDYGAAAAAAATPVSVLSVPAVYLDDRRVAQCNVVYSNKGNGASSFAAVAGGNGLCYNFSGVNPTDGTRGAAK
jgi:hypothetical protein